MQTETVDLKESKKGYMEGFEGRKKKGNDETVV